MNPREFEILNVIAARQAAAQPTPRAVQLAQKPGAPAIPEVIAVATGTASVEVAARVRAYCDRDPEYAELLATYEEFAREAEAEEPPLDGSLLAEMTVENLLNRPPTPTPGPGAFPAGHTSAAQRAATSDEEWEDFVKTIRSVLAAYLYRNDLDAARVDEVLRDIRPRLRELGPAGRLRDYLPVWVAEFFRPAGSGNTTDRVLIPINEETFEGLVLDAELLETGESESGQPRVFCMAARAQHLKNGAELLRFEPEEVRGAPWLPSFRIQLFDRAVARKTVTAPCFELN